MLRHRSGGEDYQDLFVAGATERAGRRACAVRFEILRPALAAVGRPFTVFDLGANLGYFGLRTAHEFDATAVLAEGVVAEALVDVTRRNKALRTSVLDRRYHAEALLAFAQEVRFDVVLALAIVHWIPGDPLVTLEALRRLGDHVLLEFPEGIPRVAPMRAELERLGERLGTAPATTGIVRPIYRLEGLPAFPTAIRGGHAGPTPGLPTRTFHRFGGRHPALVRPPDVVPEPTAAAESFSRISPVLPEVAADYDWRSLASHLPYGPARVLWWASGGGKRVGVVAARRRDANILALEGSATRLARQAAAYAEAGLGNVLPVASTQGARHVDRLVAAGASFDLQICVDWPRNLAFSDAAELEGLLSRVLGLARKTLIELPVPIPASATPLDATGLLRGALDAARLDGEIRRLGERHEKGLLRAMYLVQPAGLQPEHDGAIPAAWVRAAAGREAVKGLPPGSSWHRGWGVHDGLLRQGRVTRSDGRFTVIQILEAGLSGTVALAEQQLTGGTTRPVAIKVPNASLLARRHGRASFLHEANVTFSVNHPNVVRALDLFEAGGIPQLVLEYVEGVPMATFIRGLVRAGVTLSPGVCAHIVAEVCEGLAAVHGALDEQGRPLGIVHNDVRNLQVGRDGRIVLLDFGLARSNLLEEDHLPTGNGWEQPPEKLLGREQALDAARESATDVWGAGCLAIYLATRTPPFGVVPKRASVLRKLPGLAASLVKTHRVDARLARAATALLAADPSARPSAAAAARTFRTLAHRLERGVGREDVASAMAEALKALEN